MNLLLVCCLCLILHEAFSQEFFPFAENEEFLYKEVAENCDTSGIVGCSADCSSRQYCFMNSLINVLCPNDTYCDKFTNKCIDSINNCTVEVSPPFKCPGDGYYPYAIDCHKIWDCSNNNTAHVLTCGDLVYDVLEGACTGSVPCRTFSSNDLCETQDIFVTHPRNEAIYAFCKGIFPQIDVCPEYHIFDTINLECIFKCPSSGRFKDPNNPEWYYSCTGDKPTHIHCEAGKVFNEQLLTCALKKSF